MGVDLAAVELPGAVQVSLGEVIKCEAEACRLVDCVRTCATLEQLHAANTDARRALQRLEDRARYLDQVAAEQDTEAQRRYVETLAAQHKTQCASLHQTLRRANVESKHRIDTSQASADRTALLPGTGPAGPHQRKVTGKQLVKASAEASSSLRQASSLLAQQMKESLEANDLLARSSKTLKDTHKEMQGFAGVVGDSRRVITKLQRREQTNNLLIMLGLALFALTVLYVIKRRLAPSLSLAASLLAPLARLFVPGDHAQQQPAPVGAE